MYRTLFKVSIVILFLYLVEIIHWHSRTPVVLAQEECVYQTPFVDGQSVMSHLVAFSSKDPDYQGLHQVKAAHWPGVDTQGELRPIWSNGAEVVINSWDSAGGGNFFVMRGLGPCSHELFAAMHFGHNRGEGPPFSEGTHLKPTDVIGREGSTGLSGGVLDHNHLTHCWLNSTPPWFSIQIGAYIRGTPYTMHCFHPQRALDHGKTVTQAAPPPVEPPPVVEQPPAVTAPDPDVGGGAPPVDPNTLTPEQQAMLQYAELLLEAGIELGVHSENIIVGQAHEIFALGSIHDMPALQSRSNSDFDKLIPFAIAGSIILVIITIVGLSALRSKPSYI